MTPTIVYLHGFRSSPQSAKATRLAQAVAALAVSRITRPDRYLLLVQSGDEVLDYRQAIAFYAGAWQCVEGGGDHAFSGFDAQIPAILRFCALQGG